MSDDAYQSFILVLVGLLSCILWCIAIYLEEKNKDEEE